MAFTTRATGQQITPAAVNDFANALTGAMTDQPYTLNYRPASLGTVPTLLLKQNGNAPLLKGLKSDDTTQAFLIDSNGKISPATTALNAGVGVVGLDFGNGATLGVFSGSLTTIDIQLISTGNTLVQGGQVNIKAGSGGNIVNFQDSGGTTRAIVDTSGNMSFLGNGGFAKIGRDGSSNFFVDNPSGTRVFAIAATGAVTATNGMIAPSYKGSGGNTPAKIAVYDNGTATLRTITLYEGTTDPTTYATVVEGDWWLKG